MKKTLLTLLGTIILFCISTNTAKAYDFYAVNSDGDTIYYNITSSTPYIVEVCAGITHYTDSINIPSTVTHNGNIYNIKSIGSYAFSHCDSLISVTIPNSVTSIGNYAFYDDINLSSVTIPSSVTNIGNCVFISCENLTSITIPSSVTSIGDQVFIYCGSLIAINVDIANQNYSSINGVLYNKAQDTLICCPANKYGSFAILDNVTNISNYAFYNCRLTTITIPNSVTSIGNYAFCTCINLTSITIPSSITNIGNYAFWGCDSLTSIAIPNSVTNIGNYAFSYCRILMSINVDTTNQNYSSIDGVLYNKLQDSLLMCPAGKQGSFTIPSIVSYIGNGAFVICQYLTSITMGDNIISIGEYGFQGCVGLNLVTIGNGIENIGYSAFETCIHLRRIIINKDTIGGIPTIGARTFHNISNDAIIYVPCGSQTAYQNAPLWSDVNCYIFGLSNTPLLDTTIYICQGSSYMFGDSLLINPGDYLDTVQINNFYNSCYSTVYLHLRNYPTYNDTITATINQGESYIFSGQQLTTTGIYRDTLQTVNGCDSIITLNLTVNSGLNNVNNDNISVNLYPNPTSNKATLDIEGLNGKAEVFIYDLQGRELLRKEISAGEKTVELDVKSFRKGVYNVRIINDNNNITKKLIIQ